MKIKFSRQIFNKCLNINFHENLSNGNRFLSMRADGRTDGQTDMTKLIFAFRYSAEAPNNGAGDSKMLICGNAEKFGHLGLFLQF